MHMKELKAVDARLRNPRNKSLLEKRHRENFCAWIAEKVQKFVIHWCMSI